MLDLLKPACPLTALRWSTAPGGEAMSRHRARLHHRGKHDPALCSESSSLPRLIDAHW